MSENMSKIELKLAGLVAVLNKRSEWRSVPNVVLYTFIEIASVLHEQNVTIKNLLNEISNFEKPKKSDYLGIFQRSDSTKGSKKSERTDKTDQIKSNEGSHSSNSRKNSENQSTNSNNERKPHKSPRNSFKPPTPNQSPYRTANSKENFSNSVPLTSVKESSPSKSPSNRSSSNLSLSKIKSEQRQNESFNQKFERITSPLKNSILYPASPMTPKKGKKEEKKGELKSILLKSENRKRKKRRVKFSNEDDVMVYTVDSYEFNMEMVTSSKVENDSTKDKKRKSKIKKSIAQELIIVIDNEENAEKEKNSKVSPKLNASEHKNDSDISSSAKNRENSSDSLISQYGKIRPKTPPNVGRGKVEVSPTDSISPNVSLDSETADATKLAKGQKVNRTGQRFFNVFRRQLSKDEKSRALSPTEEEGEGNSTDGDISPGLKELIEALSLT